MEKKPKIYIEKIMSLFGKKKPKDSIPVTIDLCDDYFVINGKQFTIPARVSELIDILGEPRCVADRYDTERMNYYWDNFGLTASTYGRETVRSFRIKLGKKYKTEMKYIFQGTLFINSKPWQEVVEERGGNSGTFHMKLGKLHADVIRYGTKTQEFQIGLNKGEEFQYFDERDF